MNAYCLRLLTRGRLQHIRWRPPIGREMCRLPRNVAEERRRQRGALLTNSVVGLSYIDIIAIDAPVINGQKGSALRLTRQSGTHLQYGQRLVAAPMEMTRPFGWARIISSIAVVMRLQQPNDAGFRRTSPEERSGNDTGRIVETRTPRLTDSDYPKDLANNHSRFAANSMSPR